MHGDQTGRDGGAKKVMEENGPLADLEQNEDERGWFQPLLKTTSEAADRNSSRTADVLQRLDEKREQKELRTGAASPPAPASPPSLSFSNHWGIFLTFRKFLSKVSETSYKKTRRVAPKNKKIGRLVSS